MDQYTPVGVVPSKDFSRYVHVKHVAGNGKTRVEKISPGDVD